MIADKTLNEWIQKYPSLQNIISQDEVFWNNPQYETFKIAQSRITLSDTHIKDAEARNDLPPERIRTGNRVAFVHPEGVVMETGEHLNGGAVVLATEGPETARLLGATEAVGCRGEWCLYLAVKKPPITEPYLILNGDEGGWVNSLTVPSTVAPFYAPAGQHLISVVVIEHRSADDATVEATVRQELAEWFGPVVRQWRHLKTYHIVHALPEQNPPMPDPTKRSAAVSLGIYVCGEYGSVPGIQWAMLSGRRTAEEVLRMMNSNRSQVGPSVDQ